jgi:hypothetical protein
MRLKSQPRRTFWLALVHALLFHSRRHYGKREQTVRARHLRTQITHYICDWKRNGFRVNGFQPGQGGAATIEDYCLALKMQDHPAKSNRQLELQACSEIFHLRVVCYDASTNRPDWKARPWRSAPHGPRPLRLMRDANEQWHALYPLDIAPRNAPLGRSQPGDYGSCTRTSQCPAAWACTGRMCLPDGAAAPHLPPL